MTVGVGKSEVQTAGWKFRQDFHITVLRQNSFSGKPQILLLRLMEFRFIHIIKGHLFNLKSTLNGNHMCKIPSYQHIDECLTEQLDIT